MKKTTALWTLALLVSLSSGATAGEVASHSGRSANLTLVNRLEAPPQAAKTPAWKSRDEYDAFNAMTSEKDPNKKIALAEAFLQKYSTSDFKDSAYLVEMQTYQQLNQTDKAIDAARKALEANPDNLPALRFVSFTFPFLYKPDDPDAATKLSRADSDAHHGLEVLQKLQKPQGATDEQFQQGVKEFRSVFNSCIGFVALQKKDYPNAITALKAATDDNPSGWYSIYWMGLAYLYSAPRDYDHAIWYYARAVDLAKAGKDPNADAWEKYLKSTYVDYHGTDTGLSDIMTQAAQSPNPPDGFKVTRAEAPKPTGNNMVDAFNTLTYPLKLGGETAQKTWDGVKGQPIGLGGSVMSVEKGTDPNVYLVRIAVLDSTKSAGGYDVELKDSTQPNVKNLQKGDLVTYKGTADSYTATPNLILTLVGEVTSDLPDKPAAKPKAPAHHTTHQPTS
ncbi:MAG: tetratricopeptide repeat protein [Terriglobia bacterium]